MRARISIYEITPSALLDEKCAEHALRVLHQAFGLDKE
jgi:hypothetical protein